MISPPPPEEGYGVTPAFACAEAQAKAGGRGSRIRTCDLKYPKLPRYQAALYPARPLCHAPLSVADGYTVRFGPASHGLLRSFPRKRESRGQIPRSERCALDPRLRGDERHRTILQ